VLWKQAVFVIKNKEQQYRGKKRIKQKGGLFFSFAKLNIKQKMGLVGF